MNEPDISYQGIVLGIHFHEGIESMLHPGRDVKESATFFVQPLDVSSPTIEWAEGYLCGVSIKELLFSPPAGTTKDDIRIMNQGTVRNTNTRYTIVEIKPDQIIAFAQKPERRYFVGVGKNVDARLADVTRSVKKYATQKE